MTATQSDDHWTSAWIDVVAFLSVLFLAWWTRASSADLVWSLWLSSLVVGYTIILWAIFAPATRLAVLAWRDRAQVREALSESRPATTALVAGIAVLVGMFVLAFFSVHFLGFHYVHATLLSWFFPLGGGVEAGSFRGVALFQAVFGRYWLYLPAAFLAERGVFLRPLPVAHARDTAVSAEAIAARKTASLARPASLTMLPYQKVIRMHALIFFFAAAHAIGLDNFAVYCVVYAVYFFPWRLVSATSKATRAAAA